MNVASIAAAAAGATSQASATQPTLGTNQGEAVSRMSALMNAPDDYPGMDALSRAEVVSQAAAPSLGDAILNKMTRVAEHYRVDNENFIEQMRVTLGEASPSSLIRLQYQMSQLDLEVDLISKAVSKATQHIDQLTKLQ